MKWPVPAVLAIVGLVCTPRPGIAQSSVTMLSPLQKEYRIGGFDYRPPSGDGWREVSSADNELRLVYAEQLTEPGAISMRAEFVAHAFPIDDPEIVSDAASLAQSSLEQQAGKRKGNLVALSRVEAVAGAPGVFGFTLVSRAGGDQDYFERFYVALASDRSEYVVAKLTSKDVDFDKAPYLEPLQASLATLNSRGRGKEVSDDAEGDSNPGRGGGSPVGSGHATKP